MIAQIQLIIGSQIFFPLNVIPANTVKSKGVAQILHIVADSFVVDLVLVACECIRDVSCRRKVGDIVHEKIDNAVHQDRIPDFIFLPDVSDDQGIEYVRDVVVFGFRVLIKIRSRHAALSQIPGESCIPVREGIILAELTEREREHFHFKGSPCEEGGKIGTQQESVRAGNIDIESFLRMEVVDGKLKIGAHLHLVNQDKVLLTIGIGAFNIIIQNMIILELLVLCQVEIDMHDVCVRNICFHIPFEGFQQL